MTWFQTPDAIFSDSETVGAAKKLDSLATPYRLAEISRLAD
jgi:hypothetical protein